MTDKKHAGSGGPLVPYDSAKLPTDPSRDVSAPSNVAQNQNTALGDLAGRDIDKSVHVHANVHPQLSHIQKLVELLESEMMKADMRSTLIESLEFFESPYSPDGVAGLSAKLQKAGRGPDLTLALRYKEMFAKFLSRYALYGSAQELIALCLHKVFYEFEHRIHPVCGDLTHSELDEIISAHVVEPLFKEYAYGAFSLNHGLIQGMIYWLADRCFVRWHVA